MSVRGATQTIHDMILDFSILYLLWFESQQHKWIEVKLRYVYNSVRNMYTEIMSCKMDSEKARNHSTSRQRSLLFSNHQRTYLLIVVFIYFEHI